MQLHRLPFQPRRDALGFAPHEAMGPDGEISRGVFRSGPVHTIALYEAMALDGAVL